MSKRRPPQRSVKALAQMQAELAALLMEPGRLDAFARDPAGHLRRAGLSTKAAALLAGLDVEGAAYFAQRRRIDRAEALRADLPRTAKALDATVGIAAYFHAHPYAQEDPRREMRRLLAWTRQAASSGTLPGAVRDLARIEVGGRLLLRRPYRAPPRSARPRRAPGVLLLRLRHDPDALLAGTLDGPTGDFAAALRREPGDVEAHPLGLPAAALLRAADGRRSEARLVAALAPRFGLRALRSGMARLRRLGLLCPAR